MSGLGVLQSRLGSHADAEESFGKAIASYTTA